MWISVGVSSAKKKSVKCHRLATECTAIFVGKALSRRIFFQQRAVKEVGMV